MSNFAALISDLSITGSRLTDGTANASGVVWFFEPGTNTPVNVYADAEALAIVTQPITLGEGGKLPSQYPDGVFATQPVRILIQDVNGSTVTDNVYIPATAGDTGVDNAGFSGTTMDDVLTAALTSFGGQDFKYKESNGATERTVKAKLADAGVSVKDFGAVGDGVQDDTTAIQSAFNRAKALSCNVLFPAGTFKTSQAITLTSATGVRIIGQGRSTTIIAPTHASANAFTLSSCTACGISGMSIRHTSGSTGAAVAASDSTSFVAGGLEVPANGTYVGFDYGIDLSGASTIDMISNCTVNANTVALRSNITGVAGQQILMGNSLGASSAAPVSPTSGVEFNGSTGNYTLIGNSITGATNNILFNASLTGTGFYLFGNDISSVLGSAVMNIGPGTNPNIRQYPFNGGAFGYTVDVASGATATPDLSKGNHIRIRATSTGAAITIAAPTPAPSSSMYGYTMILDIFNNAGGALSNPYTMNAAYHLATAPNQTDLNHNVYLLEWDPSASVWRQLSLSVTT